MRYHPIAISNARKLLKKWMVRAPGEIDIEDIAADLNVVIVERANIGSVARIVSSTNTAIITLDKNITDVGRRRFAIAHELGHFVLHKSKTSIEICDISEVSESYSSTDLEAEANSFAVELLMPSDLFGNCCRAAIPSFEKIKKIATQFGTSLIASAIRYTEIGPFPCALIACSDKKIKWFALNASFQHRIHTVGTQVNRDSCAAEYWMQGNISIESDIVPGYAWIEDSMPMQNILFREEVLVFNRLEMTLSLIWPEVQRNKHGEEIDPNFTPDGKRYRW